MHRKIKCLRLSFECSAAPRLANPSYRIIIAKLVVWSSGGSCQVAIGVNVSSVAAQTSSLLLLTYQLAEYRFSTRSDKMCLDHDYIMRTSKFEILTPLQTND